MNLYYRLVEKTPKPVELMEWAREVFDPRKFETERLVEQVNLTPKVRVSTVFLGLDHGFIPGVPVLFETMVFGIGQDFYQTRAITWDSALEQHAEALAWARRAIWQRLRKRKKQTARFQARTLRCGEGGRPQ